MWQLHINGTPQEIEVLEMVSQNAKGKVAILYDSLKRANEILQSLSEEEFEQIQKESDRFPALKTIISNTLPLKKSTQTTQKVKRNAELPGYLTVQDTAELLGISPQSVRKYCKEGRIQAWRTLGNSGEWRILVEPYLNHQNIESLLEKYRKRNRAISEMVANSPELIYQFQQAKERRNDPNYYHNDIDRFNKMVNEDEQL